MVAATRSVLVRSVVLVRVVWVGGWGVSVLPLPRACPLQLLLPPLWLPPAARLLPPLLVAAPLSWLAEKASWASPARAGGSGEPAASVGAIARRPLPRPAARGAHLRPETERMTHSRVMLSRAWWAEFCSWEGLDLSARSRACWHRQGWISALLARPARAVGGGTAPGGRMQPRRRARRYLDLGQACWWVWAGVVRVGS